MATISRFSAVAKVGKLEISGFIGWVAWLAIHLMYLVGFRSRLSTLLSWTVTFLGRGRAQMASPSSGCSPATRWSSWRRCAASRSWPKRNGSRASSNPGNRRAPSQSRRVISPG